MLSLFKPKARSDEPELNPPLLNKELLKTEQAYLPIEANEKWQMLRPSRNNLMSAYLPNRKRQYDLTK